MNYSKMLIVFVIFTFSFHFMIAEVTNIKLNNSIKIKLRNSEKYETHVLCFTEKGVVTWDKSDFIIDDIPKYTHYHSLGEVEYFQIKGKKSLLPTFIAGGFIYLVTHASISSDRDTQDYERFYANYVTVLLTGLTFLITIAIPRNSKLSSAEEIEEFPSKFVIFSNEIPIELQEFIDLHEK